MERWDRDRNWRERWREDDERDRNTMRGRDRHDEELAHERDPRWGGIPGYQYGGDFGWRGTELDRGFSGRYEYDRNREPERTDRNRNYDLERDRNRDFDRDRDRSYGASGRYSFDNDRFTPSDRYERERYERERPWDAASGSERYDQYGMTPAERDRYREERHRYEQNRYAADDRYRTSSGDPYRDRGYERERDFDRDRHASSSDRDRERGEDYWKNYPWSRRY